MAANRAYVAYQASSLTVDGNTAWFGVQYVVIQPDGTVEPGPKEIAQLFFTYADNNIQDLIRSAVQVRESDSSLQVEFIT